MRALALGRRVSFAVQSDDLADTIQARDVSCKAARRVVSRSRPQRFRWGNGLSYYASGFTCVGTEVSPGGKAYEHFACRRGRERVSFERQ